MIGRTLAARLPETFNRAENPLQLLGIALSGSAMAPHAEIQITHDTWGSGGELSIAGVEPGVADFVLNLEKIAATGDPDLLTSSSVVSGPGCSRRPG